jgi:hypothetical protein
VSESGAQANAHQEQAGEAAAKKMGHVHGASVWKTMKNDAIRGHRVCQTPHLKTRMERGVHSTLLPGGVRSFDFKAIASFA